MKKRSELFGQDPANVSAVIAELYELANSKPELHWAALVDAAFDHPLAHESPYWSIGINCYDSVAYEGLTKAAPMLVPVDPVNNQAFVSRLLKHCYDRPMVSFIACQIELDKLSESWRQLHWITAVDQQRMILRLADTRILLALPQTLKKNQWAAFAEPVAQWLIVNRTGDLAPLDLPAQDTAKVSTIHLELEQLSALLSAAEPDNVLATLSDSMSDILPMDIRPSVRYEIVAQCCELASRFNISNWADVVSLSIAAFLTGGKTNHDEALLAFLNAKQWTPGDLGIRLVNDGFIS
ncbi:DUF4123 domain-containing protein [Pseudoduganella sp. HUAS MS19]